MQENLKEKLQKIALELWHNKIQSYYVGGCVRDELMGVSTDDYDICLVGVKNPVETEKILLKHCQSVTPLVGQKFPVWIADIDGYKIDFAMARKETLTGGTRKDFEVTTDDVSIEDDLRRRDFTINSIAKHVISGTYVDPFDGRDHILHNFLTPTSIAFKEDSLRVYRAARFLAKFPELQPSVELFTMCKNMEPTDISPERVGMELRKMLETAEMPSVFFMFLRQVGWLPYHFKELHDCINIPQSPLHHPEGDVFMHTMYSLDEANDWFTRICMVCHDLGKVTTTTIDGIPLQNVPFWNTGQKPHPDCSIKSIGHEESGKQLTRDMLTRIHFCDHRTIRQIETMVELHMIRTGVSEKVVRRTLRKLMEKHLTYEQLVEVCRCDLSGRPPLVKYTPDIGQHRAKELLESNAMERVVTGEKLMAAGYTPGKLMGHLVKKGLEWQDRGTLNEENWLKMIKQYKPEKEV